MTVISTLIPKYEEVEGLFQKGKEFENYEGWVKRFNVGTINGFPACRVETEGVHPVYRNNVDGATAVSRMIDAFKGEAAILLYPDDYRDLKGRYSNAIMYVLADNNASLCHAVGKFPSLNTYVVCKHIKYNN